MYIKHLIIFLLINTTIVFSENVTVRGYIKDKDGNKIQQAEIKFINKSNSDTTCTLSDSEGYYEVKLQIKETAVEDRDVENLAGFNLHQNYPNPFNPNTTIQFELPETGQVKLKVTNILGHEIRTLIDGHRTAGSYTVIWDGKDDQGNRVPSGIYLYLLQTENKVITKKMLIMK